MLLVNKKDTIKIKDNFWQNMHLHIQTDITPAHSAGMGNKMWRNHLQSDQNILFSFNKKKKFFLGPKREFKFKTKPK